MLAVQAAMAAVLAQWRRRCKTRAVLLPTARPTFFVYSKEGLLLKLIPFSPCEQQSTFDSRLENTLHTTLRKEDSESWIVRNTHYRPPDAAAWCKALCIACRSCCKYAFKHWQMPRSPATQSALLR